MRSTRSAPGIDMGAVFHAMPTGYIVLRPDQSVVDVNEAFLRLVERHRDDIVGHPAFDVFPAGPEVLQEGRNPLADMYERALVHRRPDAVPLMRYDLWRRGSHDLVERWFSMSAAPVLDAEGRVEFLLGTAQDVTEYVLEQQRLGLEAGDTALEASLLHRVRESQAAAHAQVQASRQVSRLADMAMRLSAATSPDDVVRIVTVNALSDIGVDGGGIIVPREDGGWRQYISSTFTTEQTDGWDVIPADSPLPLAHTARTGERVLLPTAQAADEFHPIMTELRRVNGRHAWVTLPLTIDGSIVGALALSWDHEREFSGEELELLDGVAAQTAQALERITSERVAAEEVLSVRRMSETLQRSLLTQPQLREGLQLAMRYQPAARGAQVGGDWFDAFPTRSGGTVLVVGDVSGHDQAAAAAMSQVRNLVRGISYDGDDRPANLLARLDQAMAGLGLETLATAVLAVVDAPVNGVAGRRLRWANAGHLPPLLRHHDGRVERLGSSEDLLLGLDPTTVRREHTVALVPGDVLLLYTDGLVERRGADLDDGIADVADTLRAPDGVTAGAWADLVLGTLGPAGTEDDTALLVVRVETDTSPDTLRSPAGDPQEIVLPADPRSVRDARRLARRCCHRSGLPDTVADTAELLTSELVTNAIVHGRSDTRVRITATRNLVHVEVSDDNDRRPLLQVADDDALSGRGVGLLETAASSWGVEDADIGKVVWFTLDAP